MKPKFKKYNLGFTLVELSVVLVILSMLLTVMVTIVPVQEDKEANAITEQKMDEIETAIMAYFNQKGYLPCPAALDAASNNAGTASDCSVAGTLGTSYTDVGSGSDRVRIGAVPTKELNLSEKYGYDGWNSRFTFVVATQMAQSNRLFNLFSTATSRIISVNGAAGNTINPANPSQVAYVLISHGRDTSGARNYQGTLTFTCSGTSNDGENCDNDVIFRDQFKNYDSATVYYDDFIRWKTKEQVEVIGDNAGTGRGTTAKYALFAYRSNANLGLGSAGTFLTWSTNYTMINNTSTTASGTDVTYPTGTYYIKDSKMGCSVNSFYYLPWMGQFTAGSLEYAASVAGSEGCAWSTASTFYNFTGLPVTAYTYAAVANATYGGGRAVGGQNTYYLVREVWEY
jgi:prepilin-type N-terminal cleavage/methylation domain-containing protein